jgi:hypothetical protein
MANNIRLLATANGRQKAGPTGALDEYVDGMPGWQNAIDLIPGWNHAFPPELGLRAGDGLFYNDDRIRWCFEKYGSLENKSVLELGPLEGFHTYMLLQQHPSFIHAIEANKLSYLRCLVTKEILHLQRAEFYLGNFVPWLENTTVRYDLIVACGVLYHLSDPLRLLDMAAAKTDALFLWTHYFDEKEMPEDDLRRTPFLGPIVTRSFHGLDVHLHERGYHNAWKSKAFCGGIHDLHYWIEKADLLALLPAIGFDDISIAHERPDHPNGPSFSIFARRTRPAPAAPAGD